jgi:hypothetical protein
MVEGMRVLVRGLLLVGTLWVPTTALGANPSDPGGVAGQTQQLITAQGAGGLPFTGIDLALVAIGGLTLLATGILLRRRGSRRS